MSKTKQIERERQLARQQAEEGRRAALARVAQARRAEKEKT
jgi:hypothetical protein